VIRVNGAILILAPKLREAMRKAGELVSFELPDLALVEIPIETQWTLEGFLDFDEAWISFGQNMREQLAWRGLSSGRLDMHAIISY
jgi:hypothetical protein